ncbi:unnamed protein product [Adineta steineri]|uniref:Uncharacterized protein n=1 Tax=Adineta steineri TaxID=433720 RepID=A0A815JRB0_9BILA|nr:unnamed protein product [Adineta steineri]CAF1382879.1 unnamed protein product [Adineta steineri]
MAYIPDNPDTVAIVEACCQFRTDYPDRLNGIISEDEYQESISNINRVAKPPTAVEGIIDDSKKTNLLITSLDVQPFKTLISICKPNKPTECTYLDLITKLGTNYAKVTFPSKKRVKFFALRQESAQTLTDYANVLRNKATTC